MAEKGNIGQNSLDAEVKTAHRQRDPPALTFSTDGDALKVNGGMRSGRFDGTHRVCEDTAVIIAVRIENAARHKTGHLWGQAI